MTNQHESVLLPRVVRSLGCRCCHSRDGVCTCGGSAVDGMSSVADSHAAKHRKGVSAAHPLMPMLLLPGDVSSSCLGTRTTGQGAADKHNNQSEAGNTTICFPYSAIQRWMCTRIHHFCDALMQECPDTETSCCSTQPRLHRGNETQQYTSFTAGNLLVKGRKRRKW